MEAEKQVPERLLAVPGGTVAMYSEEKLEFWQENADFMGIKELLLPPDVSEAQHFNVGLYGQRKVLGLY